MYNLYIFNKFHINTKCLFLFFSKVILTKCFKFSVCKFKIVKTMSAGNVAAKYKFVFIINSKHNKG